MVSVRKSHQITVQSFEQWLTDLALTDVKNSALSTLWQQVSNYYQSESAEKQQLLNKSMEMVEILSGLNLDADSLVAAFISPLLADNIIEIEFVKEHFSKDILMLCQGVEQMAAIKALRQQSNQSNDQAPQNIDNIRRMLLAMVDDYVALAKKAAPGDDATLLQRLEAAMREYMFDEARDHGVSLSDEALQDALGFDINLNSQGLMVWLGQQAD